MAEGVAVAGGDYSSTATREAIQVSGAIGAAHGEQSDSNCVTDCPMPRRDGPECWHVRAKGDFSWRLGGVARCDGHTDRDPQQNQIAYTMSEPPSAIIQSRVAN